MDKAEVLKEEIGLIDGTLRQVEGQYQEVQENLEKLRLVRQALMDALPADQLELDLSN